MKFVTKHMYASTLTYFKFYFVFLSLIIISEPSLAQDAGEKWEDLYANGEWYNPTNYNIYAQSVQDSFKVYINKKISELEEGTRTYADHLLAYGSFRKTKETEDRDKHYLIQAMSIYGSLGMESEKAQAATQLVRFSLEGTPQDVSINTLDSIARHVLIRKDFDDLVGIYSTIANRYAVTRKLIEADSAYEVGENYISFEGVSDVSAAVHYLAGSLIATNAGDLRAGIELAQKAKTSLSANRNPIVFTSCSQYMAFAYYRIGKLDSAMFHLNEADNALPNSYFKESVTLHSSRTFFLEAIGDCTAAIETAQKYLPISLSQGMVGSSIAFLQVCGICHSKSDPKQLDSAIVYFQQGVDLAQTHKFRDKESALRNSLGIAYSQSRQFEKAVQEFEKSMTIGNVNSLNNMSSMANLLVAYTNTGALSKASVYAAKIESEDTGKLTLPDKKTMFDALGIYYAKVGQMQKALSVKDSFLVVQTKLNHLRLDETVQKMNAEHKISEEKANNALLMANLTVEEQKRKRLLAIVAAIVFFSLITSCLLYLVNKSRVEQARLSVELEERNVEVTAQNDQIQTLNQDLNHRTSNYLGSIRFLLERQRDSAEEAGLDVTVVNSLDRQILAFTKVQDKLQATLDDVNLKEYLEDFCEAVREALAAQGRPVQFNVNVADVDVKPSFAAPLALIINELATNSMKYARREDGLLRIALDAVEVNGGELRVFYRDGGAQEGEINQEVFSSGQGVETILGFTDQLKGRVVRYGEESYDYEAMFGLEG